MTTTKSEPIIFKSLTLRLPDMVDAAHDDVPAEPTCEGDIIATITRLANKESPAVVSIIITQNQASHDAMVQGSDTQTFHESVRMAAALLDAFPATVRNLFGPRVFQLAMLKVAADNGLIPPSALRR